MPRLLSVAALLLAAAPAVAAEKPNIILIFIDDIDYQTLYGCDLAGFAAILGQLASGNSAPFRYINYSLLRAHADSNQGFASPDLVVCHTSNLG